MIRRTLGASLLTALFRATPASHEEAAIGRPIEGGSLHDNEGDTRAANALVSSAGSA